MRDLLSDPVAMPTVPPYVSIVLTGRNDNFGGDFNERFLRALVFNHEHLTAAGVPHEFVLVEWAPLPDRPFLALVAEDACQGLLARGQLVSYVVDPRYHEAFSLNDRLAFQEFIAKNVGVRRSSGEYVLTTNSDIYLGRGVIGMMAARALVSETLYRAVRIDLRKELLSTGIDDEALENPDNVEIVNTIRPPCFTNASGDFLLLDRRTCQRLGGFNEVYRVAKIHIDSNFCMKAHASGVSIVDIGAPVYHVGAGTLYAENPRYRDKPHLAPWGDIRWHSDVIYDNPPDWGMARAPERRLSTGIHFLDFNWEAVPPLVDLQRVRLPASKRTTDSRQ